MTVSPTATRHTRHFLKRYGCAVFPLPFFSKSVSSPLGFRRYCMSWPRHILQSVEIQAVTQVTFFLPFFLPLLIHSISSSTAFPATLKRCCNPVCSTSVSSRQSHSPAHAPRRPVPLGITMPETTNGSSVCPLLSAPLPHQVDIICNPPRYKHNRSRRTWLRRSAHYISFSLFSRVPGCESRAR